MRRSITISVLFLLCFYFVDAEITSITHSMIVGRKTFSCDFVLHHTDSEVDIPNSSLTCNPRKPKIRGGKSVELTSGIFTFVGLIKINPSRILSMSVEATYEETTVNPSSNSSTNNNEEIEFKEISANISSQPMAEYRHSCGVDRLEENMRTKSYTNMAATQFWTNAQVPWSFVSTGDEYATYAVTTDADLGLTKADVDTVMAAMKQIEAKTCIKFDYVKPTVGHPWLLISRDSRASDLSCQLSKAHSLKDTDIAGLGAIYNRLQYSSNCFPGAYAWYGSASPQNFVISQTRLTNDNQNDIGLVVHELLHNLGLGHTQKRQDAGQNIDIMWNNIDRSFHSQYEPCIEANNPACSRYQDYGTPYDCSSIMHYLDYFFLTDAAMAVGDKTMIAKRADCDLSSPHSTLTEADISILNKMYCANSPVVQETVITSPNYPQNYPDNQDKEHRLEVTAGSVVVLKFTHFTLEDDSCQYDWVQVVDGDTTVLMDKKCGTSLPAQVTSKTNVMVLKFHTDSSVNFAGFRVEWEKGSATPVPVDGGWSLWSGWSSCSNDKDEKSVCRKRKARYCNSPPASNGGTPCSGSGEEWSDCSTPDLAVPTSHPNCVVAGGWTVWSEASVCTTACTSTRTRTCTNPAPVNDKECSGAASESSSCTGDDCQDDSTGTVQSPNYPALYNNDEDVTFPIEVTAGSRIELTFLDFDVEEAPDCIYDYVRILDTDGSQLKKFCGTTIPAVIESSGNEMSVVFHSDVSVTKKGFQASWKSVAGSPPVSVSGVVTSPNYPNVYPHSQTETYTITVAQDSRVELTLTDLNIEWGEDCMYDYLKIYDAPVGATRTLLRTICGSDLPANPLVSNSNVMTLIFISDSTVAYEGFSATWKTV